MVVVSEDAIQCHLLASLLEHHGVNARKAQSEEQALRLLGEPGPVNAIVIDWDRPGKSGQPFSQLLMSPSYQAYRHIPILLVTRQSGRSEIADLSQFGVVETLKLPIIPQRFLASIDQILNDGRPLKSSPRILIGSPGVSLVDPLFRSLQEQGWTAHVTTTGKETRQMLKELNPDLVLLQHPIFDEMGLGLVDDIKSRHPEMAVFLVSGHGDPSFAVEALGHGVDEVLQIPITGQYIHALWEKHRRLRGMASGSVAGREASAAGALHDHASITRLANEIAHDLNNVLTSILGHAGILAQRLSATDPVPQSTQVIEQAARRGKELTAKLLGAVRPPQERRMSVNLCHIVDEVLDLVQPETNHAIRVQQRFHASDNWVKGDAVALHQIVLNLIMNACEAMPQGGTLTVETQTTAVDSGGIPQQKSVAPGRYLELIVRDTGCGIPEGILPRIFEVFFTTKGHGTGIGLATVRDVVQRHGGAVTVESQVNCGTAFHVLLPQAAGERRNSGTGGSDNKKFHVLVVDDDPAVGRTAAEILEFLGHEVIVVNNGETAIEVVRAQTDPIDVVLLDMAMEPMDGLTCFRALRMHNPAIPVILSSGYDKNSDVQQLFKEGLAGFVQKPYDVQELITVMGQVNRGHSHERQGTLSIPASVAEESV